MQDLFPTELKSLSINRSYRAPSGMNSQQGNVSRKCLKLLVWYFPLGERLGMAGLEQPLAYVTGCGHGGVPAVIARKGNHKEGGKEETRSWHLCTIGGATVNSASNQY